MIDSDFKSLCVLLVCVTSSGTSLLAKGGKIFLILIPQYVGTFLRRVIRITQNSRIIPYRPASLVEYDLIECLLDAHDVLKCVFANDSWCVKKGIEDLTLRGEVSNQRPDERPLYLYELPVLRTCQNRQCWDAFFREVVFVQRICGGASRHGPNPCGVLHVTCMHWCVAKKTLQICIAMSMASADTGPPASQSVGGGCDYKRGGVYQIAPLLASIAAPWHF